jgi:membrane protein required for colicin V production
MATGSLGSFGWVDIALLAVLALSVVVGIVRGFVFECLSLAGWVVAWFAAQWAAPGLAAHVPVGTRGGALNLGAAFALGFVVALLVWALLARVLRMLVHATPLSIPDRLFGGAFGALRGAVLLLAVAVVVGLTPAAQSQGWRSAQGPRWLNQILATLKPLLPEPAARLLAS